VGGIDDEGVIVGGGSGDLAWRRETDGATAGISAPAGYRAIDINNNGEIVGTSGISPGFFRSASADFSPIEYPGANGAARSGARSIRPVRGSPGKSADNLTTAWRVRLIDGEGPDAALGTPQAAGQPLAAFSGRLRPWLCPRSE